MAIPKKISDTGVTVYSLFKGSQCVGTMVTHGQWNSGRTKYHALCEIHTVSVDPGGCIESSVYTGSSAGMGFDVMEDAVGEAVDKFLGGLGAGFHPINWEYSKKWQESGLTRIRLIW